MEIGFIVLAAFGAAFILAGLFMMIAFRKGNRAGYDTQVEVVSTRKSGRKQGAHHFATLRYQVGSRSYTTEISTDTINQPKVGSILTVGIDPYAPEKVNLRRGKAYLVLYVIGAIVVALALFLGLQ